MDHPFYIISSGVESSVCSLLSMYEGLGSNKHRIVTRQTLAFRGRLMIPRARDTTSKTSRLSLRISTRQPKAPSQTVGVLAMIQSMPV
jgi:hypothetical protein